MTASDDPHFASHTGTSDDAATLPMTAQDQQRIAARVTEAKGDLIGPYKLLQRIGEGGFGAVWMAEQSKPIARMVALKIIKAGMDTQEVIARFEQERQALAMMDHPNIAKVLDAGATDKGRPFFVMELVKGVPITQYCDQAGLGSRERLVLFADVCSAIQHAHHKGIIHRDIKPSNVMVTLHADKPVVKVIDFGVAKATQGKLTDQTLFTHYGQFVGTPVYMSPEQAGMSGLDIDTRSDIYSLGVLLYELLTGRPPFDARSLLSGGYEEMLRVIREVEPPRPSSRLSTVAGDERSQLAKGRRIEPEQLGRLVEPDLDWIVMKAIDKDRTRRYETANAFAQDIVRFLADEPVSASPPSAGYQFRKFARRNRAALRFAAVLTAVLVAATIVSTWQAVRATRAEKNTADTLAQVAAERDAKEQARKDAEDISYFLLDIFKSPDPIRNGRTITVAETINIAAKKLETNLATQPARRAKLQAALGRTYFALGLYPEAVQLEEKVRDYYLTTFGPEHAMTLLAMNNLAVSYYAIGRRTEALQIREKVLAINRKVLGLEHPNALSAMGNLASSYVSSGRRDEALKMFEEVLALRRKVLGSEHPDTLDSMARVAGSYADVGRRAEALNLHEEVLALRRKMLGPEHPHKISAMAWVASSYFDVGRKEEALKMREEVLALERKVFGPEHPNTLKAMNELAISYGDAARLAEALKLEEQVLALRRKVLGPEHPDTLKAMNELAIFYEDADRKDEALKLREEVVALSRKVLGPDHPDTLKAMSYLAGSHRAKGEVAKAEALEKEIAAAKATAKSAKPSSK